MEYCVVYADVMSGADSASGGLVFGYVCIKMRIVVLLCFRVVVR